LGRIATPRWEPTTKAAPAESCRFRWLVIESRLGAMARNVLCLLGRHHWVDLQSTDREPYTECSRCGKYRPPYRGGRSGVIPPTQGMGGGF
jgi:hypothetical protein